MTQAALTTALAACLLTAACQEDRDVASICTTFGNDTQGLSVEVHYPDGLQLSAFESPATDEITITRQTFEEPVFPVLWRLAEPVLDTMSEVEAAPCRAQFTSTLTVTYTDGTSQQRTATCRGSALEAMMSAALQEIPAERVMLTTAREVIEGGFSDTTDACGREW